MAALGVLGACSRGLTPSETEVAEALFGDTLDTGAVTVTVGLGLLPLPPDRPADPAAESAAPAKAPDGICERTRSTKRVWRSPAAFVLWNDVHFDERFYAADTFRGFPESVPYPSSLIMAHELVHVWQWQNRDRTGYTVAESAGETAANVDPYWFDPAEASEFLSFGYEQQGALVQDFVCYALFDRDDPKFGEVAAILRPVLPVDRFLAKLDAGR